MLAALPLWSGRGPIGSTVTVNGDGVPLQRNCELNHTDHGANAVIHAGADTITLHGVTEAQLAAHPFDILI
jgi:hypothetical protein